MFGLFALLALLVAAAGLYSVVAYLVAQRTHEFGIRLAVGATASNILGLVLVHGIRVAIAGSVAATAIALVLGGFIAPQLFDVSPRDPVVYVLAMAVMAGAALAALLSPAVRAAGTDPAVALRRE